MLFLGWRLVLLLAFMATAYFTQPLGMVFTANEEPQILATSHAPLWQRAVCNWDGGHYLRLGAHGYRANEPDGFCFCPMFPILLGALHSLGLGLVAGVILLNTVAAAAAAVICTGWQLIMAWTALEPSGQSCFSWYFRLRIS